MFPNVWLQALVLAVRQFQRDCNLHISHLDQAFFSNVDPTSEDAESSTSLTTAVLALSVQWWSPMKHDFI